MPRIGSEDRTLRFYETFVFRNEHVFTTLVIQMFLLFSGCVIVVGVIYVALLITAILFHHIFFDRDPYKVPNFIKKSPQFQNDDEKDSATLKAEFERDQKYQQKQKSLALPRNSESSEGEMIGHVRGPTAQMKVQIMEQFVSDLDTTRRNIATRQTE